MFTKYSSLLCFKKISFFILSKPHKQILILWTQELCKARNVLTQKRCVYQRLLAIEREAYTNFPFCEIISCFSKVIEPLEKYFLQPHILFETLHCLLFTLRTQKYLRNHKWFYQITQTTVSIYFILIKRHCLLSNSKVKL